MGAVWWCASPQPWLKPQPEPGPCVGKVHGAHRPATTGLHTGDPQRERPGRMHQPEPSEAGIPHWSGFKNTETMWTVLIQGRVPAWLWGREDSSPTPALLPSGSMTQVVNPAEPVFLSRKWG